MNIYTFIHQTDKLSRPWFAANSLEQAEDLLRADCMKYVFRYYDYRLLSIAKP